MTAEISRIAHFTGEGLPTPVEVLRAELGKKGVVYFLSQYAREAPRQIPTVAVTTHTESPASFLLQAEFKGDQADPVYHAMLAHAALYSDALENGNNRTTQSYRDTVHAYERIHNTNGVLREARVYRARYLPNRE